MHCIWLSWTMKFADMNWKATELARRSLNFHPSRKRCRSGIISICKQTERGAAAKSRMKSQPWNSGFKNPGSTSASQNSSWMFSSHDGMNDPLYEKSPAKRLGFFWSWRSDLNRRPADYEVYKSSPTGPKPAFLTVSATSALYLWRFSLHCFRPRLSACGSRCGSVRKLFTGIWQIPFALDSDFAQQ